MHVCHSLPFLIHFIVMLGAGASAIAIQGSYARPHSIPSFLYGMERSPKSFSGSDEPEWLYSYECLQ